MATSAKKASPLPLVAKNASRVLQPIGFSPNANVPKLNTTYTCNVTSLKDENGKEFPLYMALADLTLTPTGFSDIKAKDAICRKIELMCGEVSYAYSSRTTHILAAHAWTNKVFMGRKRNVPIVTSEWVESLWDACQKNNPYIHASLSKYRNFECPIFYNLHFVFSNLLDKDTRTHYEKLAKEHGANITEKIRNSSTSFYICQQPENEARYRFALGKNVPCVSLAWINDCVRTKTTARIGDYEVRLRPKNFNKANAALGITFDIGQEYEEEIQFTSTSTDVGYEYEEDMQITSTPTVNDMSDASMFTESFGDKPNPDQSVTIQYCNGYESEDSDGDTTLNATCIYTGDVTITDEADETDDDVFYQTVAG